MRIATDHRSAILKTAARLFARKRFDEVLMDHVAEQTGIAKGTIYRYYANKEELYAAICFDWMDEVIGMLDATVRRGLACEACLEEMIVLSCEHYRRHRDFFQVLQRQETQHALCRRAEFLERRSSIRALYARVIRKAQGAGQVRRLDPTVAADLLLGMVRSLLWFGDPGLSPRAVAGHVLDVFLHGLAREPKGAKK